MPAEQKPPSQNKPLHEITYPDVEIALVSAEKAGWKANREGWLESQYIIEQ